MTMKSCANGVIQYQAQLASSPVGNSYEEDNFYPANGADDYNAADQNYAYQNDMTGEEGSEFDYATGEETSNFLDGVIGSKSERKQARADRRRRKNLRAESKAGARSARAEAKKTGAEAQKTAAESLGKDSASDVAMAQALAQPQNTAPKTGLSTGAKVGIAIGVLALLGGVVYFVVKKRKK